MKKLFFLSALFVLISISSKAQDISSTPQAIEESVAIMKSPSANGDYATVEYTGKLKGKKHTFKKMIPVNNYLITGQQLWEEYSRNENKSPSLRTATLVTVAKGKDGHPIYVTGLFK